jgi:hypothetical protein
MRNKEYQLLKNGNPTQPLQDCRFAVYATRTPAEASRKPLGAEARNKNNAVERSANILRQR